MHSRYCRAVIFAFCLAGQTGNVIAAGIETRAITFAAGTSSASIKDGIKGDKTIDYLLRAHAGQAMHVKLTTRHKATYFNVLPPGSNDEAIFIGHVNGNEWRGALPADGEYRVRVYMMRSAARRNEFAAYTLNVGITGGAGSAQALDKTNQMLEKQPK